MAGAQAIGYNDPYFLQAYNSPNYLQMQQMQQAQAQQVQQSNNTNPFASQNSVMQNITPKATEEPKKKNNTAALCILGTAAIAGTAWMVTRMVTRGKKTGAEGIFNQLKAGFKSLGKNANEQIFSFTEKNGHKFCTIPGKENVIKSSTTAADDLAKLGFENGVDFKASELITTLDDGATKLADGIKIKKGSFNVGGNIVTFEGDKVVSYVDKRGKDIMSRYLEPEKVAKFADVNKADKKFIDELIAGLKDGKKLDDISGLEIEHLYDDVTRTFIRQNSVDEFIFQQAKTNRFALDSKTVDAYRVDHPEIHELLTKFEKGKCNIGQILKAEYDGGKVGTILIENGNVSGVRISTGEILKPDSDDFKSLLYHNRELFDNIMKNESDFVNITRIAA